MIEVEPVHEPAFLRVTLEAGAAFNLLPGDWLPLTLSAKDQSDQELDAGDMSADARLADVLPFNPTLQPGGYRPAAVPRLNVIAAYGWGLVRPDGPADSSAHTLPLPTPAASSRRVGYETWWRLPVSDKHAAEHPPRRHVEPSEGCRRRVPHALGSGSGSRYGRVTYLVGYQREARHRCSCRSRRPRGPD